MGCKPGSLAYDAPIGVLMDQECDQNRFEEREG